MSDRSDWRLYLPSELRRLTFDLVAVVLLIVAVNLSVFLPVLQETPLYMMLGLPFVLFVPGYSLIVALFPEHGKGQINEAGDSPEVTERGIAGIERVVLSFGLSITIVPLVGLVLKFTPFGIRIVPILVSVSLLTLGLTAVAAYRRRELPAEERFHVPYSELSRRARAELFAPDSRTDTALNVLLVLSILLAAASVTYAVTVPKQSGAFTEAYLLTDTEDGELIADEYPTNFTVEESKSLVVGVSNHEFTQTNYTVVVELQNVTRLANGSTPLARVDGNDTVESNISIRVNRAVELQRFDVTLAHNETGYHKHEVAPTFAGEDLRLAYLVYRGEPPADPSTESAYRWLALWVNVSSDGGSGS